MDECKPLHRGARRLRRRSGHLQHGEMVKVDPMRPTLKPSAAKRLKLKHDEPLSTLAFNFKLRRYSMQRHPQLWQGFTLIHCSAEPEPFMTQHTHYMPPTCRLHTP